MRTHIGVAEATACLRAARCVCFERSNGYHESVGLL